MKWGVRRTHEEIRRDRDKMLDMFSKNDKFVIDAISSGSVSTKVKLKDQVRHTKSGHSPGRSYLNGDIEYAQLLIDKLSGTGQPIMANGQWQHKERVEMPQILGTFVDYETGKEIKTNKAMIVYSKAGSHIYPRRRD